MHRELQSACEGLPTYGINRNRRLRVAATILLALSASLWRVAVRTAAPLLTLVVFYAHSVPALAMMAYIAGQCLGVGPVATCNEERKSGQAVRDQVGLQLQSGRVPLAMVVLAAVSMALLAADEVSSLRSHTEARCRQRTRWPELFGAPYQVAACVVGCRLDPSCMICLEAMEAEDIVAWPSCGHCFHSPCIVRWFQERACCPLRCA